MRLREFYDVEQALRDLKSEIDAIRVVVRRLNQRSAATDLARVQRRYQVAVAKVQGLALPVDRTLAS